MSTNRWMNIIDKLAAGLQREAMASLQETKEYFDQEGGCFDEQFEKDFYEVSNDR